MNQNILIKNHPTAKACGLSENRNLAASASLLCFILFVVPQLFVEICLGYAGYLLKDFIVKVWQLKR